LTEEKAFAIGKRAEFALEAAEGQLFLLGGRESDLLIW